MKEEEYAEDNNTIIVYLIALTNYCCQCRKQVNIEIEIYDVRQLSQREPQEMLL